MLQIACKENVKNSEETEAIDTVKTEVPELSPETIKRNRDKAESIMAKLMLTQECKQFASYMVTTSLTDTFFYEEGPFTIFAPTNDAIQGLGGELNKNLSQKQKIDSLANMIKGHVVSGEYDTVRLVQELKSGPVKLTTMSGTRLTVTRKGSNLLIKDEQGNSATIGKSDIKGGNGVLHLIDSFLSKN